MSPTLLARLMMGTPHGAIDPVVLLYRIDYSANDRGDETALSNRIDVRDPLRARKSLFQGNARPAASSARLIGAIVAA